MMPIYIHSAIFLVIVNHLLDPVRTEIGREMVLFQNQAVVQIGSELRRSAEIHDAGFIVPTRRIGHRCASNDQQNCQSNNSFHPGGRLALKAWCLRTCQKIEK